jgi:hypothetical protein
MKKKTSVMVVILLAVLVTAIPALAHAPAEGTVVEGVSVPGIALGETRAQVDDAYGHPASCTYSTSATCSYNADGGGQVNVTFRAPDGGPAQNSPDDVVTMIGWEPGVTGWVTTAGIDITIARDDPQAVLDAYPNAEVTYWYDGTFVAGVRDWQSGITISRWWEFYCGCAVATMAIFHPQDPPPEPEPVEFTYVAEIDMSVVKIKRNREITAQVLVNDRQDLPAAGAVVSARWHLPDGSEQSVQATTADNDYATFMLTGKLERGTYYLFIDDVQLADHIFIESRGLSYGSIGVK